MPYKIHLKADEANGTHTRFTVFVNGENCGQLTMREKEAVFFHNLVLLSKCKLSLDEIIASGKWIKENDNL